MYSSHICLISEAVRQAGENRKKVVDVSVEQNIQNILLHIFIVFMTHYFLLLRRFIKLVLSWLGGELHRTVPTEVVQVIRQIRALSSTKFVC